MDLRTTSASMPLNCSSPQQQRNGDPLSFDFLTESFVDHKPVTSSAATTSPAVANGVAVDRGDGSAVPSHHNHHSLHHNHHHHEPSSFFLPSVGAGSLALSHHQQHQQHPQHHHNHHPLVTSSPRPGHGCLSPHPSAPGVPSPSGKPQPAPSSSQRYSSASPTSRASADAAAAAVASGSSPLSGGSPHVLPHSSFDHQSHQVAQKSFVDTPAYYSHVHGARVTKAECALQAQDNHYASPDSFQQQPNQPRNQSSPVMSPPTPHSFQRSPEPNDMFCDPVALYASLYAPDAPTLSKAERRRLRCLLRARRNPRRRIRSNLRHDAFFRSGSGNATSCVAAKTSSATTTTPTTTTTATSSSCGRNVNSLHHYNSSGPNMLSNCNNINSNHNSNEHNRVNRETSCSITTTAISSPTSTAVAGMSLKDKKAARVIRNREVALRARQMAKLKMKNLESENCSLKSRATSLESENLTLRSYVHRLTGGRMPPLTLLQSDSLANTQGQWQQSHDGVSVDGAAIPQ